MSLATDVKATPGARSATVNQADAYGVRLQPADVSDGTLYWNVTAVRHLTPDENRGKRNIYTRVLDEQGQHDRNPNLRVAYTWEGRRPDENAPPRPFDKGDSDIGHADIDVYKGQHIEVWIEGDGLPSDRVANLHTDHDVNEKTSDGEDGNTRYHHSYLVTFQRTRASASPGEHNGGTTPAPQPPVQPGPVAPVPAVDDAIFLSEDDNVADGSRFNPGDRFSKVWVVRNSGTTTWDDGYRLRLVTGPSLGAPASAPIPETPPGQVTSIRVDFRPTEPTDLVRSEWRMANAQGSPFGHSMWTDILVADPDAERVNPDQTFPPPNDQLVRAPAGAGGATLLAANFWNRYGGLVLDECRRLYIDPADAVGVLLTESGGQPFDETGRMIIRFENHLFWHYWGKANPERFRRHFQFATNPVWDGHRWRPDAGGSWQPCHIGSREAYVRNAREWQILNFARSLDDTAALKSISMGAPQIMGFNHAGIGYPSPQAMFHTFEHDAGVQLRALFRFMEVNNLVEAVQRKDYRQFALVYNGPGQPDYYGGLMRDYAAAFAALQPTPVAASAPQAEPAPVTASSQPTPRSPMPASPQPGTPLASADPKLYAAWRTHIENGFKNNETMFKRVLDAFMNPYWSTVWMYRILFGVGIAAFVVAALTALIQNNVVTTLIFGGLSVTAFLSFFVSKPLQALEENLQFITWLGIIYNTYWTSLVQSQDPKSYNQELKQTTEDAISRIQVLIAEHANRSSARPDAEE